MRDVIPWLAALAVALVLLGIGVWLRRRRTPAPGAATGPLPGDIWWADVPYEEGTGHKVRPCVVLRVRNGRAEVLKITSQDQRHRRDHVEIPTRAWDRKATRNSFLDLSGPVWIGPTALQRRAGAVDAATWRVVRQHHPTVR